MDVLDSQLPASIKNQPKLPQRSASYQEKKRKNWMICRGHNDPDEMLPPFIFCPPPPAAALQGTIPVAVY